MITFPKDTPAFSWTRHIKNKMVFYHLSGAQILRIFRKPNRREEGIAPNTIAAMQSKVAKRTSQNARRAAQKQEEIWIMYKLNTKQVTRNTQQKTEKREASKPPVTGYMNNEHRSRVTMISAWRYPGTTKPGERPPIPPEIAEELEKGIY